MHCKPASAGGGRDDLVVNLAPGGKLALRLPTGVVPRDYRVRSGACVFIKDAVGTGEVVTPWLPTGKVSVELIGARNEMLRSTEAVVRAGETLLVDLSEEP